METNPIGRVPPHSIEAEKSVLGSMLLDKDVVPVAAEMLREEDFYREDHRKIYTAILGLFNVAKPIDIITVTEELRLRKHLDTVGGIAYLTELADLVPTTANVRYYARIVEEKSTLRKLIKASSEVIASGYDQSSDPPEVLELAERTVFDIAAGRRQAGIQHIEPLVDEAMDQIHKRTLNRNKLLGVPSGFYDLDKMLLGFQKSDLVIIAARPGVGKTSLALNIAANAALRNNIPVAIFSLEMSQDQLLSRILSSETGIELKKIRSGQIDPEDWEVLAGMTPFIKGAPIYIDDSPAVTITDIRSKCRRLAMQKKLGMVIIDYLQLMQGGKRSENRQQEIAEISRSMKILAKELQVPLLCLSQLNRAAASRADKKPILSDMRESGAIEQDADVVIFIYREEDKEERTDMIDLIIAKHRNGETGELRLIHDEACVRFKNGTGMNPSER